MLIVSNLCFGKQKQDVGKFITAHQTFRMTHFKFLKLKFYYLNSGLFVGTVHVSDNQRRACMTLGAMLRHYRSRDAELSDQLLEHLHSWLQHHQLNGKNDYTQYY